VEEANHERQEDCEEQLELGRPRKALEVRNVAIKKRWRRRRRRDENTLEII
jgi:hypothetical protein